MVLRKSDLVRTGPGAAAEITFFDGTVVHVRPDSLITIEETSEDPNTKRRRVAWHISSGEVNFQTRRTGRRQRPTRDLHADRAHDHAGSGRRRHPRGRSRATATSSLYTGTATVADEDGRDGSQLAANDAGQGGRGGQGRAGAQPARRARAPRAAPPGGDHLPGPRARHDAPGLEAGARRRRLPRRCWTTARTSTGRSWTARASRSSLGGAARPRRGQVLLAGGRRGQGRRGGQLLRLRALHGQPARRAAGAGPAPAAPGHRGPRGAAQHPPGARAAPSRGRP